MADMYSCPACKAQNHEHQKYCYQCGTWLQSTTFPAKKINSSKPAKKAGYIVPIVILVIVAIGIYNWSNEAKFDRMELGNQFVLSQFVIKRPLFREPSAVADLIALEDANYSFEVQAVFYDEGNNRLGTASALIYNGMAKGETATVAFKFDGSPSLMNMREVRVQVKPLSFLELIEKATDRLKVP